MKSMTGFGKSEVVKEDRHVFCEIKSVNQRFLDLQFKMPKEYNFLELTLRKLAQRELNRGRVEVNIDVKNLGEGDKKIHLNQELLTSFLTQLKEVEEKTNRDLSSSVASLWEQDAFLTLETKDTTEENKDLVLEAFEKALFHLKETREEEGQRLLEILKEQKEDFTTHLAQLAQLNGAIEASHYGRLKEKLEAFLKDQVEENRLLTEVALVVEKGDIHEELDRLSSHLKGMDALFEKKEAVGRQLDFLVQEMNREVNTIGSKSMDISIKEEVVSLKTILEKFREQIQNTE